MKLVSKFMLTILCANLAINCFAGSTASRERREREDLEKKVAALIIIGGALYAGYKYLNEDDKDNEIEERREEQVVRAQQERQAQEERARIAIRAQEEARASAFRIQEEQVRVAREQEMRNLARISAIAGIPLNFGHNRNPNEEYKEPERGEQQQHVLEGRITKPSSKNAIISLSNKQLNSLKQQFDNIMQTPANWGSKKLITFNYKEIFNTTKWHVGHYDPNNELSNEQKIASTVFPSHWQPNKIMSKIKEAYLHSTKEYFQGDSWIVVGVTSEGIIIRIIFKADVQGNPTGKVKTAYPIKS